jgi:hypothetical protein
MHLVSWHGIKGRVAAAALLVCLVFVGCQQDRAREVGLASFHMIKMGMTEGQVTAIFGPGEDLPSAPAVMSGTEKVAVKGDVFRKWGSADGSIVVYVGFEDGKVAGAAFDRRPSEQELKDLNQRRGSDKTGVATGFQKPPE